MEHGAATWQLPLQPGPEALLPTPPALAAAAVAPPPHPLWSPPPPPASCSVAEQLRAVARGGVVAMAFSPQVCVWGGYTQLVYEVNLMGRGLRGRGRGAGLRGWGLR